jgi:ribonuclease E
VEAPQEQAEAELETPLEVTPVQAVPVEMAAPEVVVQEAASAGGVAEAPQPQPDAMEAVAPDAASSDSVVAASEVAAPEVAVESPDASAEDAGAEMMTEVLFVITPARVERTQKRESLPYLPHVGPPPLRLESAPKADRTRLVGLAAFNAMMEARRAALAENAQQEAPDAQAPQPVAQRPADVPQQTAAAEAPQQPARPATTTTTTISQSSVAVLSSGQDAAFDPALILPYFETRNGPQGRGTGVQFVLPHQQPQAPLVMQSRATYGQSEAPGPSGAVQNGGGN